MYCRCKDTNDFSNFQTFPYENFDISLIYTIFALV